MTTDEGSGTGEHVGPGSQKPDQVKVEYDTVPPSHGPHFAQPAVSARKFYTAADRPPVETLVHNLEHGYTVLWYDGDKAKGKEELLRDIADQANKKAESADKFLVVEWDTSRGAFPAGQALRPRALVQGRRPPPDVRRPVGRGHRRLHREAPGQRHAGARRRLTPLQTNRHVCRPLAAGGIRACGAGLVPPGPSAPVSHRAWGPVRTGGGGRPAAGRRPGWPAP